MLSVKYSNGMTPQDAAKALGRRGGRARARRLSSDRRRAIASQGGAARRESFAAARRVADNFVYAATVVALRGGPSPVERMSKFAGPLPAIRGRRPRS
jgi:hypothetical protein